MFFENYDYIKVRCSNFIIKGVWHHIAITMEGSTGTISVYKDGYSYDCPVDLQNITSWSNSVIRPNLYLGKA